MGSDFQSFNESALGGVIQSPLGVRGFSGAVGDVFVIAEGSTFNGVSGSICWRYSLTDDVWSSVSGLSGSLSTIRLYVYKDNVYATGAFNGVLRFNPGTSSFITSDNWSGASNHINVFGNPPCSIAVVGDLLYITTRPFVSTAIEVSSGGDEQIVKFDGAEFTAIGSLPATLATHLAGGQGHLIFGSIAARSVWYSSDGTTWNNSTAEMNGSNDYVQIFSNGSRILGFTQANGSFNDPGGSEVIEYSSIVADSFTLIDNTRGAQGGMTQVCAFDSLNNAYYAGTWFFFEETTLDGVLKLSAGSQLPAQFSDTSITYQDINGVAVHGDLVLVGTDNAGSNTPPPYNFYDSAYAQALGSSGTSSEVNAVLSILSTNILY